MIKYLQTYRLRSIARPIYNHLRKDISVRQLWFYSGDIGN